MSTIHVNQPAEAGDHHLVGQTVAAFGWSRHWSMRRRIKYVVQQQVGYIEHLMWKLQGVTVTLDNNWDNKQAVSCC